MSLSCLTHWRSCTVTWLRLRQPLTSQTEITFRNGLVSGQYYRCHTSKWQTPAIRPWHLMALPLLSSLPSTSWDHHELKHNWTSYKSLMEAVHPVLGDSFPNPHWLCIGCIGTRGRTLISSPPVVGANPIQAQYEVLTWHPIHHPKLALLPSAVCIIYKLPCCRDRCARVCAGTCVTLVMSYWSERSQYLQLSSSSNL